MRLGKKFLMDVNFSSKFDQEYINFHYKYVLLFIYDDLENMKLQNEYIDGIATMNLNMNILICALPLLLNLPWWSNICSICVAVISRFVLFDSS